MKNAFDKFCSELAAARDARNARKAVVAMRKPQRQNRDEILTKALSAHKKGAISASNCGLISKALDAGVPIPAALLNALQTPDSGASMLKSEPLAIADVRSPLSIIGEQKDTRRRLSLAHEAGAISKANHHHLCKLLDSNKPLPADIARELAKIKLEG
jgi:hypothetical protein